MGFTPTEFSDEWLAQKSAPIADHTLGWSVIQFIEDLLCHGPGDIQGEPLILDNEMKWFILQAYELYPADHPLAGRRVYRRAVLSRPKGRAKSELAGALAVCEAVGPVRCGGWEDGYPVGVPVKAPVVRCFATEETQAGNTFDNALFMIEHGAVWEWAGGFGTGKKQIDLPDGGMIVSTTSAAQSKDGGKDTFDVFDETHLWVLPRLKSLHSTVTRNLLKRKTGEGWALETTTMYCPGEDSVAEETFTAIEQAKGHLAGVLWDHRQAPEDIDIKDDSALLAALTYVYGPAASWMDLDSILQDAFRDPTKRESDGRRFWLNQPWSVEDKFLMPNQWDAIEEKGIKIAEGSPVVIAFEGSFNNQCAGIVACSIEETPIIEVMGFWERDPSLPVSIDWQVPRSEMVERIWSLCKQYDVRMIVASPVWGMELESLDDERLPVAEFNIQSRAMIIATKRLYDCITCDPGENVHKVRHNGHYDLRRHMIAATVKEDDRGVRVRKDAQHPQSKIDLCIAAIMATDTAMKIIDGTPGVWSIAEELARLEAQALGEEEEERERFDVETDTQTFHPIRYN